MRIKAIRKLSLSKEIPVYDIEVPGDSNFTLSSGVVVHNSKDASDGVCGALYNASLHASELSTVSKSLDLFFSVNEQEDGIDSEIATMQDQLIGKNPNKAKEMKDTVVKDEDDIDTVLDKVSGGLSGEESPEVDEKLKNYYASLGIII